MKITLCLVVLQCLPLLDSASSCPFTVFNGKMRAWINTFGLCVELIFLSVSKTCPLLFSIGQTN